jgi:hypothetical protein
MNQETGDAKVSRDRRSSLPMHPGPAVLPVPAVVAGSVRQDH